MTLDSGFSSGDIELFNVALANPFTDPFGNYPGSYTLTGGIDGNAQDVLASADFSVTAQQSTVPEPSSLFLLGTSLFIFSFVRWPRYGAQDAAATPALKHAAKQVIHRE